MILYFLRYSSNFGPGRHKKAFLMVVREALDWANVFCLYSRADGLVHLIITYEMIIITTIAFLYPPPPDCELSIWQY